jgi:membrane protease YdiL (CAAX protease family)
MTSTTTPTHPAPLRLVLAAFVAYSLAHLFNNTVLQLDGPRQALLRLQIASNGWIEPVLVRSQVVLAAFLLVVVGIGSRSLADVGWRARDLLPGFLVYASAWAALQLGLVLSVLRQGVALEWHPMWTRFGLPAVLGGVIAQACGHALAEDTAFRGFFLPELRARLAQPLSFLAALVVLAVAVGGSALLFGLAHLPTRLVAYGSSWKELFVEQGHFLSAGIALGLAYLSTRNLFVVVGLHVLLNDPAPLVAVPGTVLNRAILIVFGGVVLLGMVRRIRRSGSEAGEVELRRAA